MSTERKERRTVCLLTNWYPTPENPHFGLFFREQALALSDRFDFLVVHYTERIRKRPGQKDRIVPVRQEKNISEFAIEAVVPAWAALRERAAEGIFRGLRGEDGSVFAERSCRRERIKEKKLIRIFGEHFRDRIDLFYCVDAQREAADVQLLAGHFGKPYIVGEHGPVPWPGTVIPLRQKKAIEGAAAFLAISWDKVRQMEMQNIRLPKVVYVGNLVLEEHFPLRQQSRMNGRRERMFTEGTELKTLITVGAYSFYKNYDLFISVMNRLTELTEVPFRVMIVGYGANPGYAGNAAELEKKIRASRFADRAELIPSVPHEKMSEIYRQADAFVMTSIQEGQPVSALEAACSGLPVFSTRCGGVEDYVDESMGRIVGIREGEALALALRDFLEGKIAFDPAHLREQVVSRFGREAFSTNFMSVV
ncbi:MAG: glycosyltransferase [Clostridia bacterium]|nr:glycosyltransferase [Clostridia bacterium]